jgi:hypothetical protein
MAIGDSVVRGIDRVDPEFTAQDALTDSAQSHSTGDQA